MINCKTSVHMRIRSNAIVGSIVGDHANVFTELNAINLRRFLVDLRGHVKDGKMQSYHQRVLIVSLVVP